MFLEDSKRIKDLEQEVSDLKHQLDTASAKALKLQDALITETQRNLILEDKVREYERILRSWRNDC